MDIMGFAAAVVKVRRKYQAKITSWGRSDVFAIGFKDDPHTWDLAVDMLYPSGPNRPGSVDHPRLPHSCPHCSEEGLKVIHEKDHDHYQPADFPAGPVRVYAGIQKNWT